jgi:hypothetical protein
VKEDLPLPVYRKSGMQTSKADSYVQTTVLCFSHSKTIQAPVIAYDIFQALVVEADILLLELLPHQDLDDVRWKTLTLRTFLKFAKCGEVHRGQFRTVWWVGIIFPTPDAE